jgi:penicillin-binding protein 2
MDLLSPIKDHHSERRLFVGRVALTSVTGLVLLGTIVARLVQLQIVNYEDFAAQSQGNRMRIEAVPPIRGLIFDRKGRVLAENLPAYQLELIPEQVPDLDDTLQRLAALGLIESDDIPRLTQLSRSGPRFKPVTLKLRLTDEEIANFAIQRPRFPGVDFQPRLVRHYPYGPEVAHAVGYVGALSTDDLQRLDSSNYAGTAHTGKTGVENSFEENLHGEVGYQHVVSNALGRHIAADTFAFADSLPPDETPSPGSNVYLSLDLDLQRVATEAFEGHRGAAVAIDPWTGEILALVSAPTFDPNLFAVGMSSKQFAALQDNIDRPLFNRAIRGTYPPGSTVKPLLALAALESGATTPTRKVFCRGYYTLPNSTHRYRDWKPQGHGEMELQRAIEQSCDVYFYEISRDLGIDRIHYYLSQFGLGTPTGIDIRGENTGLVPSREWKRKAFRDPADQRWFDGETVITAIGQGYMLATPLQLANAAAALATRGIRYKPHLVAATEDAITGERTLVAPQRLDDIRIDDDEYWDIVRGGMHDVMQNPHGTAYSVGRDAPYQMAGKSGTAQVFSVGQDEEYDPDEVEERLRDHALFIAFAPFDDPRIAVAIVLENGVSGSRWAAPIARAIMDQYLGYGKNAAE